MNQSPTINRINNQTKRMIGVDIEHLQAKTRLTQQLVFGSSYSEVRCIRCEIRNGVLYLRGQVTSFYLKQLTQEAVRWMDGIDAISNCLAVIYPDRPVQTVSDALMPERRNKPFPNVLLDVSECQLNSACGQLSIGQL